MGFGQGVGAGSSGIVAPSVRAASRPGEDCNPDWPSFSPTPLVWVSAVLVLVAPGRGRGWSWVASPGEANKDAGSGSAQSVQIKSASGLVVDPSEAEEGEHTQIGARTGGDQETKWCTIPSMLIQFCVGACRG